MDPASGWLLLLIPILIGLSALFSGSETAFFSLDALKLKALRESESSTSKIVISLLSAPRKLLITILVGNETVNIAATAVATALGIELFGSKGTGLAIISMLLLILIFGEITPKTIALHHPSEFVKRTAYLLNFFHKLITPLRRVIQMMVDYLIQPFMDKTPGTRTIVTEEEFHSLVEIGQAEGVLEGSQQEMIKNALEFTDTTVAEVMTPREEIFCLPIEETLASAAKKIKKKFFARIPIYESSLNQIKGVLYTKDLLIVQHRISPPQAIREMLHPPYFVASDKKVVDLLREFQKNRIHLAIVMDKTGKTTGLVTLEDLLEELFGEIVGEVKSKVRLSRRLGPNRYLVSAMIHIEDFNQRFDTEIDEEEYDTLGGLLQELCGAKPYPGEKCSYQEMKFTIHKTKGRRILEILLQLPDRGRK